MKNRIILVVTLFIAFVSIAYTQQKMVLVEVMTNSHCGVCPNAHNALDDYVTNNANGSNLVFVYYHMSFPYPDDALNQYNTSDPAGRNSFYGNFFSTPKVLFDGDVQQNVYANWPPELDSRLAGTSPLSIELSGSEGNSNSFNVTASVTKTGTINENDLTLNIIVVEDVEYSGRNGISEHDYVMRKMVTTPAGESFTITGNETKVVTKTVAFDEVWDDSKTGIVVFVQSTATKEVFQAAYISYPELIATGVENYETDIPQTYNLDQNYPNPFNPETSISFSLPEAGKVSLKVYNAIGKEAAEIINRNYEAGTHSIRWRAADFSSGIYYYRLTAGNFTETKKMILLK